MIVVLLSVVLIVIGTAMKRSSQNPVDFAATQSAAQRLGLSPVAPSPVPSGWRAISVNVERDPFHWHLGFRTTSGAYAGIEQGGESGPWLKEAVRSGQWQGWEKWDSPSWRALRQGEVVVCGDASWSELKALAVRLAA